MKYDPIKKTVSTEADESIFALHDLDKDMVIANPKPVTLGERQVFEKERLDNDSVSTFQSKRAPPTEIATGQAKKAKTSDQSSTASKTSDQGSTTSSTSSLSITTKNSIHSMNTRMTAIETEMKGVEARLASKVDLILQQLQIQQQGQIVTPTKTSNDGLAAHLENPGDSQQSPGQS